MESTRAVGAWILAAIIVLGMMGLLPSQAAAHGDTQCYDHELEVNPHGQVIDGQVVLYPFNPEWFGDHWQSLTAGGFVVEHPEAGVPYGEDVTVWSVCKAETPETTTTTTTTTPPPPPPDDPTTTTTIPYDETTTTTITTTTTQPPTTPPTLPINGIEDAPLYAGFATGLVLLGGLTILTTKRR